MKIVGVGTIMAVGFVNAVGEAEAVGDAGAIGEAFGCVGVIAAVTTPVGVAIGCDVHATAANNIIRQPSRSANLSV